MDMQASRDAPAKVLTMSGKRAPGPNAYVNSTGTQLPTPATAGGIIAIEQRSCLRGPALHRCTERRHERAELLATSFLAAGHVEARLGTQMA
jgi:hypothetical protein